MKIQRALSHIICFMKPVDISHASWKKSIQLNSESKWCETVNINKQTELSINQDATKTICAFGNPSDSNCYGPGKLSLKKDKQRTLSIKTSSFADSAPMEYPLWIMNTPPNPPPDGTSVIAICEPDTFNLTDF